MIANRESHPALMTVLALPKLRVPLKGRILVNSDELICNPINGLQGLWAKHTRAIGFVEPQNSQ